MVVAFTFGSFQRRRFGFHGPLFSRFLPLMHSFSFHRVARTVCPDGKPAFTRFHVTAANTEADLTAGTPAVCAAPGVANLTQGAALVSCEPLTGRTHQIRVHLGHTGHPIVGDDIYGVVGPWLERQALHAATLTLKHPSTGLPLTVTAPLPEDFRAALRALGLGDVDEAEALKQW